MNLNKVFLIGRLAADPETRTTPSGQSVTTIRIATNRVWNNRQTGEKQEQVEFHTIVAWSGLGEVAAKYLHKGGLALFEGRLQTRSWEGQDGVKRYKTEIVAEGLQLGPRPMAASANYSNNNQGGGYQNSQSFGNNSNSQQPNQTKDKKEEEIPVINQDEPVSSDPVVSNDEVEEKEIDLKDIPF